VCSGDRGRGQGVREGVGEEGRNDPNIYAHMNKTKINKK
jgi:hypothetical protein